MNEIYATDLASVMNVMDSMTANSLKTASVPMVTSTGLQYASCTDARAAVKASFASPQGVSIMKHIGQMNQFIEPAKEETGQKVTFCKVWRLRFLEALVRLTISPQGLLSSTK